MRAGGVLISIGNSMNEESREQIARAPQPAELAIGIQFHVAGKIYTFMTADPTLKKGEAIVVEADGGTAIGFVATPPAEATEGTLPKNAKKVLHRASDDEIEEAARLCEKSLEHLETCRNKILEHGLPMKLIDAEIVEGGRKIVFSFFAEQRVDFRGLVKDLASALHMRIEMRQVGARDESKLTGSLGPCGLTTCCSCYLRQFKSISIAMAKQQGLTPNPAKLTGMCGKLKCCLSYEHSIYLEYRRGLPKVGASVESPKGAGKIVDLNILRRECAIQIYGGQIVRLPCDSCRSLDKEKAEKAIAEVMQAQETSEDRPRKRQGGNSTSKGKRNDKKR